MKSSRPLNKLARSSTFQTSTSRKGPTVKLTTALETKQKFKKPASDLSTHVTKQNLLAKSVREDIIPVTKFTGTSVKRKLSISLKNKAHSVASSNKREKPDPDLIKKVGAHSKPRISCRTTMHRTLNKDNTPSINNRENFNLHSSGENVYSAAGKENKNYSGQLISKEETCNMKEMHKSRSDSVLLEVETLQTENRLLRDHLKGLGISLEQAALSDAEKEFLLQKKCNSAPPSIYGVPLVHSLITSSKDDVNDTDGRMTYSNVEPSCSERGSLEWDKQSSSSLSEISVACLQDRILQMEETHYSTSEELQATLQELSDLQDQLIDLQGDNERLLEEKTFLLESLCNKVQQLEEHRLQIDNLQQVLLHQKDDKSSSSDSDRENKILELFKQIKEEKEILLVKQDELNHQLSEAENKIKEVNSLLEMETEHGRLLESKIESTFADKRELEQQLDRLQEQIANDQIESSSIRALLDSERTKVFELQQVREIQNKSELDKLLDQVRKEKDRVESKANLLQEQLSISQCETGRLRDQLLTLQEENLVIKNNAKSHISELDFKLQQVITEKNEFHRQILEMQETVQELEHKCQRQRELRTTISELQKKLNDSYGQTEVLQRQLTELQQRHTFETEEWKQFQCDLLTSVRVANDFKTEAQIEKEKIAIEKRHLQERVQSLEAENERLKLMKTTTSPPYQRKAVTTNSQNIPESVVTNSIDNDVVVLRSSKPGCNRNDSRLSVKSLIATFNTESTPTKQNGNTCITAGSTVPQRPVSSPGINCLPSPEKSPIKPILRSRDSDNSTIIKSPTRPILSEPNSILRDQKNQTNTGLQPLRLLQRNSYPENIQKSPEAQTSGLNKTNWTSPTKLSPLTETNTKVNISTSPISNHTNKSDSAKRLSNASESNDKKDPLANLAKGGGSKRNALLKWCQNRTLGYKGIDITNFSSSWNDGLAFCALLHSYVPDIVPYDSLDGKDKRCNFSMAFNAAESLGIKNTLNPNDLILKERPDWQAVMSYVTSIYKHFET